MAMATYRDGAWSRYWMEEVRLLPIHPALHALHYGSSCFEGLKAYRWADGSVHAFRLDRHIARMRRSAEILSLPKPDDALLTAMVMDTIRRNRDVAPEAPGALYLRPLLFGTNPHLGLATAPVTEAMLLVLASPVWDFFASGAKPLRILLDEHHTRCAGHMGEVKTGGNYAAALYPTLQARAAARADQVLFAPGGSVQETGAANFLLLRPGEILTPPLSPSILHGVTRDALLTLARDLGYAVTERPIRVEEVLAWLPSGEAALAGTAAVLTGVGTLIHDGIEHPVGSGEIGETTQALRSALIRVQRGESADTHGWLQRVD